MVLALVTREPLPTASAWGAWAYLVVAGSMVAFTSYVRVLKVLPMSISMTYAYVNLVIAVLLGWLVLREPVTLPLAGGMVLILAGVWASCARSIDVFPSSPFEAATASLEDQLTSTPFQKATYPVICFAASLGWG